MFIGNLILKIHLYMNLCALRFGCGKAAFCSDLELSPTAHLVEKAKVEYHAHVDVCVFRPAINLIAPPPLFISP